jgi:hypothetical protein
MAPDGKSTRRARFVDAAKTAGMGGKKANKLLRSFYTPDLHLWETRE